MAGAQSWAADYVASDTGTCLAGVAFCTCAAIITRASIGEDRIAA